MPNDFCVTFMSNVSDPLYNDLNKTSDFWTKLSPAIKFDDGKYEVALVDCILKNTYDILRKDHIYDIKIRPYDWPLLSNQHDDWPLVRNRHKIETIPSVEYSFVVLPYEELNYMNDLCCTINKGGSARK